MKIKSASRTKAGRHQPLGQQILAASAPVQRNRVKVKAKGASESEFLDTKSADRVLKLAHEQQYEEESAAGAAGSGKGRAADGIAELMGEVDEELDDGDEIVRSGRAEDGESFHAALNIDEGDEEALKLFMAPEAPARMTLADIVMGKIKEKETEIASQMSAFGGPADEPESSLDPKVIKVFTTVGSILATYRSGKLPKAFKVIPSLKNWEEILFLTQPDGWSAAAMYEATRIFTSNLNAAMAQRFFNLVLLPRIRDDILDEKKLNFHLYMALKKTLFKPAAFYKGILIPLCQAGDCSLREAVIVASVIARTAIPVLHTSAAMLHIAEMPYTGANSIFLRVMLDKKYALPYRVVDAMVHHFYRFVSDDRQMPVLWHQCLLIFIQRYKEDVTSEQKEALLRLLRKHSHRGITDDIRREIVYSRSRDNEVPLEREPLAAPMAED